ncbi:MAG: hypothetical protein II794_03270 [Oscillospiraceae bacterium]|nr:hypothetical protein [Oscillospiraceae bacterium]
MRKTIILLLVICGALSLWACGEKDEATARRLAGTTYVWEKPGAGGYFTITLQEDGRFSYYAGFLSSHMGFGSWTVEDGILTLDEGRWVFRFRVGRDAITYIAQGSDQFMYVTVEDGDRFFPIPAQEE